nr:mannosyl-oligosaccharide alpha-1,2-mannosidase 1b [Quercus suber]
MIRANANIRPRPGKEQQYCSQGGNVELSFLSLRRGTAQSCDLTRLPHVATPSELPRCCDQNWSHAQGSLLDQDQSLYPYLLPVFLPPHPGPLPYFICNKAVMRRAWFALLLAVFRPNHVVASSPWQDHESSPQFPHHHHGEGNLVYPRQKGCDYDYTGFPRDQNYRAETVIEMFRFAWSGYYEHAYPHDDLRPQNSTFTDSRNGREQQDIVNIILEHITKVDFTKNQSPTPVSTSLFETNIRYIGGMLSSYDLLKGPFAHLASSRDNVDALLKQATSLADTLKFAFDTPTGIPVNLLYIDNQTFVNVAPYYAGLAELGTLQLEWQRLSDLTGNPEYGDLVQKAESYWFNGKEVWPGLTGGNFSIETGEIVEEYGGWTSGNDSAYEYLLKMYVYDPKRYANYSERWSAAADSTITHLLSHPSTRRDLTAAGTFAGTSVQNYTEQLACFMGGNFILGAEVLGRPEYLKYGLDFSEFCADGYRHAASGVGPIIYSWNTTELERPGYTNQTELYNKAGWFINDNDEFSNGQAPEAVESWYYAYQVTGDQYWRDVAWAYTIAQNQTERVGSGWASINDVLAANGNGTSGVMASYMLAEKLTQSWSLPRTWCKVKTRPETARLRIRAFLYTQVRQHLAATATQSYRGIANSDKRQLAQDHVVRGRSAIMVKRWLLVDWCLLHSGSSYALDTMQNTSLCAQIVMSTYIKRFVHRAAGRHGNPLYCTVALRYVEVLVSNTFTSDLSPGRPGLELGQALPPRMPSSVTVSRGPWLHHSEAATTIAPLAYSARISRSSTSPALVTSTAGGPCARVSKLAASTTSATPSATPTVPAELAYECLNSIPFDSSAAVALLDSIRPYLDWQTTFSYVKDPPAEYAEKVQPPYDFHANYERIYDNAKNDKYSSEYEFGLEVYECFSFPHDGHLALYPDSVTKIFSFGRTTPLVSVSVDGTSIPEVFVYSDILEASYGNGSTGFIPSPLTMINGEDSTEWLLKFSQHGSLQDRDALWNNMFYLLAQVSLGPSGTGTGTFTGGRLQLAQLPS